jgi:putative intracellular protease/amidase
MQTQRILLVVTSSDRMGTAPEPTGFWLEEVAAPYYAFIDAKCEVTIASPLGGKAPQDPRSQGEDSQTASTRRFAADVKAQKALDHTLKLSSLDTADYDAVFFAGGHGTMEDFAKDPSVKACVENFWKQGRIVASVCHGPACLTQSLNTRGEPIIKGRRFTCFTDNEERAIALDTYVPFLLESRLREQGGIAETAENFKAHVVVDGQLITGQNPPSSIPVAEAIIYQLRMKQAA